MSDNNIDESVNAKEKTIKLFDSLENFIKISMLLLFVLTIFLYTCSIVVLFIFSVKLAIYYSNKIHGLHKTILTYTGEFIITSEGIKYNSYRTINYYYTKCYLTSPYGTCVYNFYKSKLYQYAKNYGINNCIKNNTFIGYISTNNNECYISYPNESVFYERLIVFCLLSFLICSCILCCVNSTVKSDEEEINDKYSTVQRNENQNDEP